MHGPAPCDPRNLTGQEKIAMKFEPLSHCPARANTAVLRADFGTRTRSSTVNGPAQITGSPTAAAPDFLARMRSALARLFRRNRDAKTRDHGCRCDVETHLLELEMCKLNAQMLGNPRD
ncbi:hypothetical protein PBS_15650 [Paraburkholderia sp. 2C]